MSLLQRLMSCEPKSNAEKLSQLPLESRSDLKSKSYERWEGCQMLTEQQQERTSIFLEIRPRLP